MSRVSIVDFVAIVAVIINMTELAWIDRIIHAVDFHRHVLFQDSTDRLALLPISDKNFTRFTSISKPRSITVSSIISSSRGIPIRKRPSSADSL